jgi:ABC-2 type transport system ATP-binding protein
VDHVTKRFVVPHERRNTLKERVLHPVRRSGVHRFEALDDVTFAVERGEFFGIVGRNGSGKSSLRKCLAGIYRPDAGEI